MPQNGWHFPFFFLGTAVAGARTAFSPSSGPVVCVRKSNSLALRGTRTQTLPGPGPPFPLFPARWFAYENRIHWLCGQSYANPAGAQATFSALSGAPVCVRKPNSLALRAVVRKPCRRPGHLFCSFRCPGLRTQTEFIDFAGTRTQTLPAPGPPFLLFSG